MGAHGGGPPVVAGSVRAMRIWLGDAVVAGALTFVVIVAALLVYAVTSRDACVTDPGHPVDERWSGTQRLAAWPPAAMRCDWTTPSGDHVAWTITAWPLWLVYGAVLAAAVLAVGRALAVPLPRARRVARSAGDASKT